MTMLNLRDVYPFYHSDLFVEVSQEVAEAITTAARRESNARRQMYRYKAQYSLDRGDGIEHEMWAPFGHHFTENTPGQKQLEGRKTL